eukprot:GHVN01099400.1.p1 GENE.GHVN01099400.1~~GHVN01099400.1.p1  ORF type:complete len:277 (-),score=70.00 GHVN01099400.1:684-1415(-)
MPKKERTESRPPSIVHTGAGIKVRAVTEKPEPTELLEVEPKPEGAVAEPGDTSEGEEAQSRLIEAGGVEAAEGGEVTEASEVTGPPPSPNVPGVTEATSSEGDERCEGAEVTGPPTREDEPISGPQPPKGDRDSEAEVRIPFQSTEESEPPQPQTATEPPEEGEGGVGAKAVEPAERDKLVVATPTTEAVNIEAGGEIRITEIETPVVTEAIEAPTTGATSEEPPTHATRLIIGKVSVNLVLL